MDADAPDGRNYRAAVSSQALLSMEDVAGAVWQAVHGDDFHYPVGELPKRLVSEIDVAFRVARARARDAMALGPIAAKPSPAA